jgi:predicted nucleic acid-binding protein
MILVDSSVWIAYFNGVSTWQTDLLDKTLSTLPVIMGDLILTEVLQGFRSNKDYEAAKSLLSDLPFRRIGGYEVAVQSTHNYRMLRQRGVTVRKTIDVMIGTFCILEEVALLHDDRDFDPMVAHCGLRTPSLQ